MASASSLLGGATALSSWASSAALREVGAVRDGMPWGSAWGSDAGAAVWAKDGRQPRLLCLPPTSAAARGAEGTAEEERQTAVRAPPRAAPLGPIAPAKGSPMLVASGGVTPASLDRIEMQAKSSIEKLKHILYKLRTRPRADEAPEAVNLDQSVLPSAVKPSATTVVKQEESEVYISQKIEVDLSIETDAEGPSGGDEAPVWNASVFDIDSQPAADAASEVDDLVHLDALTCTRTTVQFDEENQTAVVTVTATVRAADFAHEKKYTERTVAMAARALTRTCLALDEKAQLASLGAGPLAEILPSKGRQDHAALLRQLGAGRVLGSKPAAEGSTPFRQVYEVILAGEDGKEITAFFKPAVGGDTLSRWKRAPADWVAYQVSSILGMDMVPPSAIRQDIVLCGKLFSLGVMVYKVADVKPLKAILAQATGPDCHAIAAVSDGHILDALLGSAPRKQDRFMAGRHWAATEEVKPMLLDHPVGPGFGDMHAMWSQRGVMSGLKHAPPPTLARLRGLTRGMLVDTLSGALTPDEMELILEKRDQVVAYFDAVASRRARHLKVATM